MAQTRDQFDELVELGKTAITDALKPVFFTSGSLSVSAKISPVFIVSGMDSIFFNTVQEFKLQPPAEPRAILPWVRELNEEVEKAKAYLEEEFSVDHLVWLATARQASRRAPAAGTGDGHCADHGRRARAAPPTDVREAGAHLTELHVIRERDPSVDGPVPGGVHRVFCPSCHKDVYLVHLETAAIDPGARR